MALTKVTGDFIKDGVLTQAHLHSSHGITSTHIGEGDKLFFTNARARGAISVSGNALSYNSSTGVITSNFEESPTFTGNVTINKASNPTKLQIGSSLADDPFIHFQTDGENYSIGVDRSDSNKFKISNGSDVATNTRVTMDTSGNVVFGGNFHTTAKAAVGTTPHSTIKLDVLSTATDWTARIKNYTNSGYGLAVDCSGADSSTTYALATYSAAGGGLFVRNDDRVGIRTTSPSSILHVHGTQSYGTIRISPTSTNGESAMGFFMDTNGTTTGTAWIAGQGGWANQGDFVIGNQAFGGPVILAQQDGKVGIGTTSPTHTLHVKNSSGDVRGIMIEQGVTTSYAELAIKSDLREFRLGTGGDGTNNSRAENVFYIYDATTGGAAGHRFEIGSTGDVKILNGALKISSDDANYATLTESGAGLLTIATVDDFVVDAGGDIAFDADGGDIRLRDAGATFGQFTNSSQDFQIWAATNDKDLVFKGYDNGTAITALTLDMSAAGSASFNNDVTISGNLTVNGTTTTVNQTNLDVSDNIIGLNRGASSNANDSGLIIERGSTGDNATILWDESIDQYVFGLTTATPSDTGNVALSTFVGIKTGAITASGNITASSSTGHFSVVNSSAYQLNGTYVMDSSRNLVNIGNITATGNTILGNAMTDKVVVHGHLGVGDDVYPKIAYPGQNALWGGSGSTTGQIVIDLPGTLDNYDMMYMEIDIYEYSGDAATKLIVGGHNWNSGGNSNTSTTQWYNVNVQVIGRLTKPVYVGRRNDGTNERRCIAIGETTSTWSYATVHVHKVHGAEFYGSAIDWVADWNIAQTTSTSYFTKNPTTNFNDTASYTLETNGIMEANMVYGTASVRSPIFFDLNNTNYYVDPAGTTSIRTVGAWRADSSTWDGEFNGKIQHHGNYWYLQSSNGVLVRNSSGANNIQLSGSGIGTASNDWRSPQFYDSANTTFVLDPNGTSVLNNVQIEDYIYHKGDTHTYFGFTGDDAFAMVFEGTTRLSVADSADPVFTYNAHINMSNKDIDYVNQLHFGSNVRFYDEGNDSYLNFKFGDTSYGGIKMIDGSGNLHGYFYADGDNSIGILDADANWAVQVDTDVLTGLKVNDVYRLKATTSEVHTYGNLHNDTSMRAPVFYDSDNTGYYVNPAGDSQLSGDLAFINGAIGSIADSSSTANQVSRIVFPQGGAGSWDGSQTGAIKIQLPIRANNNMWTMKVRIYCYNTNQSEEYFLGNYSYSNGGYHSQSAFHGGESSNPKNVRFGNDGSLDCVWIGETNSSWSYPVVSILDFQAGFRAGSIANNIDGYNISIVTSFDTVQTTISPNTKAGSIVYAQNSFRAPHFYDSNDTTYYLDPNGTSILKVVSIMQGGALNLYRSGNGAYAYQDARAEGNYAAVYKGTNNGSSYGAYREYWYDGDSYHSLQISGNRWSFNAPLDIHGGNVWDATTQGLANGTIHIDPDIATDHGGGAITFGASDTSNGTTSQAGIYVRSDGSYGTRMYLSTTDSYASGSKTTVRLEAAGGLYVDRGNFYAPIFYDSNNTNYYSDPGATSRLAKIDLREQIQFPASALSNLSSGTRPAYAIYQEGGSWSSPFPDLCIAMHTGIKMGANASYNGIRFYSDYQMSDGATMLMSINDSSSPAGSSNVYIANYALAGGSFRGPIFYDSNNTTYYTRPSTSSLINTLYTAGTIQAGTSGTGNIYLGNNGGNGTGNHFRFHTNNSHTYFDGNCGDIHWRQGSSTRFIFYMTTANMTVNGTVTQNSDERIKENIITIDGALDKVNKLRGVYYNRNDINTSQKQIGLIAQEVETVIPEVVLTANDELKTKSISYAQINALLIEAIKEQKTIIDDLKSRVETLENQ